MARMGISSLTEGNQAARSVKQRMEAQGWGAQGNFDSQWGMLGKRPLQQAGWGGVRLRPHFTKKEKRMLP